MKVLLSYFILFLFLNFLFELRFFGFGDVRGLQVCFWIMEKEAVRCYEVSAEGQVLGVSPTPFNCSCYEAHTTWQGSPSGV